MVSYAITGAARGIGFEFVNQLSANENNTVLALVRTKSNSQKLAQLGRNNVHIIEADINDYKSLQAAAVESSRITGGSLDVLICNAAFVEPTRSSWKLTDYINHEESLEKDFAASMHTNVVGTIHTINSFLPLLHKGSLKKVITISTGLGSEELTIASGFTATVPYAVSKTAVNHVVVKYATEFRDDEGGWVFLALSPGLVDTAIGPPTEKDIKDFQAMLGNFQRVKPDFSGPISPEVSVGALLKVIGNATREDSGKFLSHWGNKEWL